MNNNEVTNYLDENSSLRTQIETIMTSIKYLIEETSPLSSLQDNDLGLNNILDDLPLQQQISLYQDSITEIKRQLKFKQVLDIEHIENEIKSKLELIYNLKTEHDSLIKHIRDQSNIINNPPQSEIDYLIKLKSVKAKDAKETYREMKQIQNSLLETIKQQNNAIYTLEDNCLFIKENIDYKKKLNENDQCGFSFEDLDGKANQMEVLAKKQEEYYKGELMKQMDAIENVTNEVNELSRQMEEINKEIKGNELRMRMSQKKSFHNTSYSGNVIGIGREIKGGKRMSKERNDNYDYDLNNDNDLLTCNLTNYKSISNTQKLFELIDKSVSLN